MNGTYQVGSGENDIRPDLLPHKYRPDSVSNFSCQPEPALRLKQWIQEFMNSSNGYGKDHCHSDSDESSSDSYNSDKAAKVNVAKKCVLLTGPPGVGKTSLVYTVAKELKLHVVESHPAEKRDSKLFSMLKLTNQKGKINPIAKLFQQQQQSTKRKRRKLVESSSHNQTPFLSLSGGTSIILFDDIDVVFDEDGPFLKSLVEFIKESKRPVIVTATQSLSYIMDTLVHFEHIELYKPFIEDCTKLLKDVCKREKYHKLSKTSGCQMMADHLECDIRQCLNLIHFYGDQPFQVSNNNSHVESIRPNLTRLQLETSTLGNNESILKCYTISSLVDLMDSRLRLVDRSTLLERWLNVKPSLRDESYNYNQDLGEQIKESIIELTRSLHLEEIMNYDDLLTDRQNFRLMKNEFIYTSNKVNEKIKSRIEPPELEYYTEIAPVVSEMTRLEQERRLAHKANGGSTRRSRRVESYLDKIPIYLDPIEFEIITRTMLNPDNMVE